MKATTGLTAPGMPELPYPHKEYYDEREELLVLPGLRVSSSRTIVGKDSKLFPVQGDAQCVYLSKYPEQGICLERVCRAASKPVYEEVTVLVDGALKAYRVEVFEDGTWTQVEWKTGKRKIPGTPTESQTVLQ